MRRQMGSKNLSYKEVAAKINWSPEHIRKLYNSEAFPSKPLQRELAVLLGIDPVEFESQINADRWRVKYGKIPGGKEASHPIDSVWKKLSKDQQSTLLCMAHCMVRQKRKVQHSGRALDRASA